MVFPNFQTLETTAVPALHVSAGETIPTTTESEPSLLKLARSLKTSPKNPGLNSNAPEQEFNNDSNMNNISNNNNNTKRQENLPSVTFSIEAEAGPVYQLEDLEYLLAETPSQEEVILYRLCNAKTYTVEFNYFNSSQQVTAVSAPSVTTDVKYEFLEANNNFNKASCLNQTKRTKRGKKESQFKRQNGKQNESMYDPDVTTPESKVINPYMDMDTGISDDIFTTPNKQ